MTSKIFFDTQNELEGLFSDSDSKLESEEDWFGEPKHLLSFINLFLFFMQKIFFLKTLVLQLKEKM